MNWTDERVELLRKLWAEGLSASQIAGQLGGVSRNAVIGKVHRLKLSSRGRATAAPARQKKTLARSVDQGHQPAVGNRAVDAGVDRRHRAAGPFRRPSRSCASTCVRSTMSWCRSRGACSWCSSTSGPANGRTAIRWPKTSASAATTRRKGPIAPIMPASPSSPPRSGGAAADRASRPARNGAPIRRKVIHPRASRSCGSASRGTGRSATMPSSTVS